MSRRTTLPGADELFRATGQVGAAAGPVAAAQAPPLARAEDLLAERHAGAPNAAELPADADPPVGEPGGRRGASRRRPARSVERRPSGRERHDEKITVYVSAEELMELEHARLTLRGDYGVVVDRGRIVREALAFVLADLDAKGDASILVRRVRGR